MAADMVCANRRVDTAGSSPIIDEAIAAFAASWAREWKAAGGYLSVQDDGRKCITWPIYRDDPDRYRRIRLLGILDAAGRDARDAVFHLSQRGR